MWIRLCLKKPTAVALVSSKERFHKARSTRQRQSGQYFANMVVRHFRSWKFQPFHRRNERLTLIHPLIPNCWQLLVSKQVVSGCFGNKKSSLLCCNQYIRVGSWGYRDSGSFYVIPVCIFLCITWSWRFQQRPTHQLIDWEEPFAGIE